MSRVPSSAAPDVQETIRSLWREIDVLKAAAGNRNQAGGRVINAGDAVDQSDYVTLRQLRQVVRSGGSSASGADFGDLVVDNLTVNKVARFLAHQIFIAGFADGTAHWAILFVKSNTEVGIDEDHLSFNQAANKLELGFATRIKWFNSAHFGSPDPGYLSCGDAADTGFTMLILGPTRNAAFPGFVRNGAVVEVKLGDQSDFTNIKAQLFIPKNRQTYTPTNVTTLRTGDFSTLSAADVRSILGTLIIDLQAAGLLA